MIALFGSDTYWNKEDGTLLHLHHSRCHARPYHPASPPVLPDWEVQPRGLREKWLRGTSHSVAGLEVAASADAVRLDSSTFGAISTATSSSSSFSSSEVVVERTTLTRNWRIRVDWREILPE
ncbi:unnamed protein product [Taenia asiatica]|uniref:Uncharacterized protein n=1 Tax=Taenia asiatica TaxID=60517 RepID=A0A0R3VYL1_TAEAS|nr:unnamed protein product [Taenia asiatica]